jgi:hypothetical protein
VVRVAASRQIGGCLYHFVRQHTLLEPKIFNLTIDLFYNQAHLLQLLHKSVYFSKSVQKVFHFDHRYFFLNRVSAIRLTFGS